MLPTTLKVDSTNQDENDVVDAVGLYSCEKCYCQCNTISRDIDVNALYHNFMLHF